MAKKSKSDRLRHLEQKRRARLNRILNKYRGHMHWADRDEEQLNALVTELSTLNVKYLHLLFASLDAHRGYGDPNQKLREKVETLILEKTVLK